MKLKILILVILLICGSFFIKGQNRQIVSLDGIWRFTVDSTNQGMKENWQNGIPSQCSHEVKVPHTWNIESGTEDYAGLGWYQKNLTLPDNWKNKNIRLKFNAVYHDATVYINGKKAGENLNAGFTPFVIDITQYVNFNSTNTIVVKVNNEYSEKMFPYKKSFDWVNDGGIIRPVSIEITGNPSIRYVHITPKLDLQDSIGDAMISIILWEKNIKKATFRFVFKEKKSGKVIQSITSKLSSIQGVFSNSFNLGKIKPWHFDFPDLYVLETSIITQDGISDNEISAFGFRKLEIKGDSKPNGLEIPGHGDALREDIEKYPTWEDQLKWHTEYFKVDEVIEKLKKQGVL